LASVSQRFLRRSQSSRPAQIAGRPVPANAAHPALRDGLHNSFFENWSLRALVLLAAGSLLSKSWGTTLLFQKINGKLIKELWRLRQFLHPDLVFEELDALDRPPANSEASSPNKNKHSYMRL
jgi:hypothetical protein